MSRVLAEDLEIDGYLIPAKTNIILGNFLLHRNKDVFPNPDSFDPDRFSLSNQTMRHPYAYVPFSAGPRNCIGQKYDRSVCIVLIDTHFIYLRFAMMEEKVLISTLLRRFSFSSDVEEQSIPLMAELVLRPKNGLHMSVKKHQDII